MQFNKNAHFRFQPVYKLDPWRSVSTSQNETGIRKQNLQQLHLQQHQYFKISCWLKQKENTELIQSEFLTSTNLTLTIIESYICTENINFTSQYR